MLYGIWNQDKFESLVEDKGTGEIWVYNEDSIDVYIADNFEHLLLSIEKQGLTIDKIC